MSARTKLKKAAVVLKNLPQAQSNKILARLEANDLRSVFQAINNLDVTTTQPFFDALSDLARESQRQHVPENAPKATNGSANPIVADPHELSAASGNCFGFLFTRSIDEISALLADEHPREIAAVFNHLPQDVAASLIRVLEPVQRVAVVKRMCESTETEPANLTDLVIALKRRLQKRDMNQEVPSNRKAHVAGILRMIDSETSVQLVEQIPGDTPIIGELAKARDDGFEALRDCTEEEICRLFPLASCEIWASALRGASDPLRDHFMSAIKPQDAERVKQQMRENFLSVSLSTRVAQQRIFAAIDSMRRIKCIDPRSTSR